jgi:hypothetical protein
MVHSIPACRQEYALATGFSVLAGGEFLARFTKRRIITDNGNSATAVNQDG